MKVNPWNYLGGECVQRLVPEAVLRLRGSPAALFLLLVLAAVKSISFFPHIYIYQCFLFWKFSSDLRLSLC